MSIFFRNPVFQALSDAGMPLPGAYATFLRADTDALAPIYADAALETLLANPLTANSSGVFPVIYMDDEIEYRVQLHTAAGVLRWDIDPYVCTCAEPE